MTFLKYIYIICSLIKIKGGIWRINVYIVLLFGWVLLI